MTIELYMDLPLRSAADVETTDESSMASSDFDDDSTIASASFDNEYSDDSSFFESLSFQFNIEGDCDREQRTKNEEEMSEDENDSIAEDSVNKVHRTRRMRRYSRDRPVADDDDSLVLLRKRVDKKQHHCSWSDRVLEAMEGDTICVPLKEDETTNKLVPGETFKVPLKGDSTESVSRDCRRPRRRHVRRTSSNELTK